MVMLVSHWCVFGSFGHECTDRYLLGCWFSSHFSFVCQWENWKKASLSFFSLKCLDENKHSCKYFVDENWLLCCGLKSHHLWDSYDDIMMQWFPFASRWQCSLFGKQWGNVVSRFCLYVVLRIDGPFKRWSVLWPRL